MEEKIVIRVKGSAATPKRVYVAGPMRGYANYNYAAFREVANDLRAIGLFVINPTEISALVGTPEEIDGNPALLKRLMEADLALLKNL